MMTMNHERSWMRCARRISAALFVMIFVSGCGEGGSGSLADNGGMSGTGISQGAISSFGSIFVNGVRWDVSGATILIDGEAVNEDDLRVGMVVRVEGDFAANNLSGTAIEVSFEDLVEGPIADTPVETVVGVDKTFTVLDRLVTVNAATTIFDGGTTFANLTEDDVVEISGFESVSDGIVATRVSLRGVFPADSDVERDGEISGLGAGVFNLDMITVRFTGTTEFSGTDSGSLMNGDEVAVEGTLRASGTEIDATKIELTDDEIEVANFERVEVEGIAVACAESPDFCVSGIPIDPSMATFDPPGFTPMIGDEIEVEGPLVSGILIATEIESEEEDDENEEEARIEAAVTSVNASERTLVILGVTVRTDGDTVLEDDSSADDENFSFAEIMPGDYLEIEGVSTGSAEMLAECIERDDATSGDDDLLLEGPVTSLDTATPTISVFGQAIPLSAGTAYFDDDENARTEEQFFRVPGDVMVGDIVRVVDDSAANLSILGEADEVSIEDDD